MYYFHKEMSLPIGAVPVLGKFLNPKILEKLTKLSCATEVVYVYNDHLYAFEATNSNSYTRISLAD